jgi:predicted ABC-type ATPase
MKRRKAGARLKIIIIAGPNGAGKTTFAHEFLPKEAECAEFINADLIARGLSPFDPEKAALAAGKIMLNQIATYVNARKSFAFETNACRLELRSPHPKMAQCRVSCEAGFSKPAIGPYCSRPRGGKGAARRSQHSRTGNSSKV